MKGFEKHDYRTRRQMLKAGAAGLSGLGIAATFSSSVLGVGAGEKETQKIRYSNLLLHELRRKLDEKPLACFPLGTLEQHGPHLALAADAIQSEGADAGVGSPIRRHRFPSVQRNRAGKQLAAAADGDALTLHGRAPFLR